MPSHGHPEYEPERESESAGGPESESEQYLHDSETLLTGVSASINIVNRWPSAAVGVVTVLMAL